jgi:hypothetical protein
MKEKTRVITDKIDTHLRTKYFDNNTETLEWEFKRDSGYDKKWQKKFDIFELCVYESYNGIIELKIDIRVDDVLATTIYPLLRSSEFIEQQVIDLMSKLDAAVLNKEKVIRVYRQYIKRQ